MLTFKVMCNKYPKTYQTASLKFSSSKTRTISRVQSCLIQRKFLNPFLMNQFNKLQLLYNNADISYATQKFICFSYNEFKSPVALQTFGY